jgi:hypothetical protein
MSEKNKNRSSKKWLISRMKTSGSKRERVGSYDYADTRNTKSNSNIEDLPTHESMSKNFQFYNGKINTDLLKRFLRTRVNQNWDTVYSEIIERIPTKLQDYKYCVYWYVADKVEIRDEQIWNLKDNSFIPTNNEELYSHWSKNFRHMEFYVDPETKELIRIDDFESRRATKNLNKKELREYRENEKREKLEYRKTKKTTEEEIKELKEILSRKMKNDQ